MNCLIIFIKNPVKGHVKTRLAAAIGEEKAYDVYEELVRITREAVVGNGEPELKYLHRWVFYSKFIDDDDEWPIPLFHKFLQEGEGLGGKMESAFKKAFNSGARKVVIVGSDCAEITSQIIIDAYKALDDYDFVIGPANDGGYYLLGMKELHPDVFRDKTWSTWSVLSDTLESISRLKKTVHQLPELIDVDYEEDLEKVRHLLRLF